MEETIRQVLAFMAMGDAPFLQARAFTCAASFARTLPAALLIQLLQVSLGSLRGGTSAPVQISAITAIRAFCQALARTSIFCRLNPFHLGVERVFNTFLYKV